MKIDWISLEKKSVLRWFILESMSKAGIDRFGKFDSRNLDVVLTINNIEVPITEPMDFLQSQLERIEQDGASRGRAEVLDKLTYKILDWKEELDKDETTS